MNRPDSLLEKQEVWPGHGLYSSMYTSEETATRVVKPGDLFVIVSGYRSFSTLHWAIILVVNLLKPKVDPFLLGLVQVSPGIPEQ